MQGKVSFCSGVKLKIQKDLFLFPEISFGFSFVAMAVWFDNSWLVFFWIFQKVESKPSGPVLHNPANPSAQQSAPLNSSASNSRPHNRSVSPPDTLSPHTSSRRSPQPKNQILEDGSYILPARTTSLVASPGGQSQTSSNLSPVEGFIGAADLSGTVRRSNSGTSVDPPTKKEL